MSLLDYKAAAKMTTRLLVPVLCLASVISCSSTHQGAESGKWESLFNGKDLDDWVVKIHRHEVGENFANTFRVSKGVIQVNYDNYDKFSERYGHLFYKEPFSSYHLKFEYRFTEQWLDDAPDFTYRNSGVMFHSQAPNTILKEQTWPVSIEYQLLAGKDDGIPRPTGNMCSPGTNVVFDGKLDERHCINSSSDTYQPGQWVKGELIVFGDSRVVHKVNGKVVLQYSEPQVGGWGGVVSGDPNTQVEGKLLTGGYIGLQSEGQGIEFKNIKIKAL